VIIVKKSVIIFVLFIFAVYLGFTVYQSSSNSSYIIFGSHENLDEGLRENLVECLKDNNIIYKINENGSVLIKEKDQNKAVMTCS
jgi:flagellar biosynthesis/type III secretory pathway M-ring protein FliF/YscJ